MDISQIKVVVSDMDGTLLSDSKTVLESSILAIKKIKEKGLLFGLCTGRDANNMADVLIEKWNIKEYVDFIIGCGGAQFYNLKTKEYKKTDFLNGNAIKDIINHYQDLDVNFGIPDDGYLYFPKENRHSINLSKYDHMTAKYFDIDNYLVEPKSKVMIVCDKEYMPIVVDRSKSFKSEYEVGKPLITGPILFEYMHPNVSKTNGLKIALKDFNLTLDNVLAFGDADNDYDMILNAKIGVAMINGSDKTKSVAQYITEQDNNNDGIYNFITKYLK